MFVLLGWWSGLFKARGRGKHEGHGGRKWCKWGRGWKRSSKVISASGRRFWGMCANEDTTVLVYSYTNTHMQDLNTHISTHTYIGIRKTKPTQIHTHTHKHVSYTHSHAPIVPLAARTTDALQWHHMTAIVAWGLVSEEESLSHCYGNIHINTHIHTHTHTHTQAKSHAKRRQIEHTLKDCEIACLRHLEDAS